MRPLLSKILGLVLVLSAVVVYGYERHVSSSADRTELVKKAVNGDAEAFATFQKEAETGDALAEAVVGNIILQQKKDCVAGVKWLQKAAQQGLAETQYELSGIFKNGCGSHGEVPKNFEESYYWRLLSEKTQKLYPNLPDHLARSDLIITDPGIEAKVATEEFARYEANLTPDQIVAVKRRVEEWKPVGIEKQ